MAKTKTLHVHWCALCGRIWEHSNPCKHVNAKDEIRFFVICKDCFPKYRDRMRDDFSE